MRNVTIVFMFLLAVTGCARNNKDVADDEMEKALNDFQNRPIYKNLTTDIMNGVSDENLEQTIIDNIQTKMNKSFSNEAEIVRSLSDGQKAIYVTWILEAEVNNGGFNQFYYNSSGEFADLTVEAFTTIGATRFAELARRANRVYDSIKNELAKNEDGSAESFSESYEDNPLNELDSKFYDLYKEEPLNEIKIKYIRRNIKEFVTD